MLSDVCAALVTLVQALTGLDTVWIDQPRPEVNDVTRGIALLSFTAVQAVGRDEVRSAFDVGTQDFGDTAVGQRILPLRIRVESYDQNDTSTAWNYLERLRTRLRWQSSIDALQTVKCGVAVTGPTMALQVMADDRAVSAAALDVSLNCELSEADPTRYPYVAEIQGTSQLHPGAELPFDIVIP